VNLSKSLCERCCWAHWEAEIRPGPGVVDRLRANQRRWFDNSWEVAKGTWCHMASAESWNEKTRALELPPPCCPYLLEHLMEAGGHVE